MQEYFDHSVVAGRKINTILSWLIAFYLLVTSINIFLDGNLTWAIYSMTVTSLVLVPAVYSRDVESLVPFEILVLLAIPFTLKGVELGFIASHTLSYLSAAGVALLLMAELDRFTSFRTTSGFAVLLVTLTTVAISGLWAVTRWLSDIYLGTGFIVSESLLMWEFAAAALAGIVAGKAFSLYFRRHDRRQGNG